MIHLYAIARAPWQTPVVGLDGRPVTGQPVGDLVAAVSEHDRDVVLTAEAATTHAAVVDSVSREVDALPVRFATGHADVGALAASIADVPDLRERLDRVGGQVEYVVRTATAATDDDRTGAPPAGGRAYLEAMRDRERRREQRLTEQWHHLRACTQPLTRFATEVRDRDGRRGPERCLLVARDRAAAVERELAALRRTPGMVVGGPWPPFTFADAALPEVAS